MESKSGIAGLACRSTFLNDSSCRMGTKSLRPKDKNRNFHSRAESFVFSIQQLSGHLELSITSLRGMEQHHCSLWALLILWTPKRALLEGWGVFPLSVRGSLCPVLAGGHPCPIPSLPRGNHSPAPLPPGTAQSRGSGAAFH